ncbi:MAG TPA: hypothetical protein V6C81_16970 [Planktothrix sp.]|jgi:hypothetical protein
MLSKGVLRRLALIALLSLSSALTVSAAQAKVLQGNVEQEDTRLSRPSSDQSGNAQEDGLRIERPMPAVAPPIKRMNGLLDASAFSRPLSGNVNDNGGKLGLLQPAQFGTIPANKFDLGADRGSKELVLAWEKWHHQLSGVIYQRWSEVASVPGEATLRVTVSRNRQLTVVMVHSSGSPAFDTVLLTTVQSLNGNPGLTFPAKSERNSVTFEADYVAATDIQPGYSWVKNDYEKVRENY